MRREGGAPALSSAARSATSLALRGRSRSRRAGGSADKPRSRAGRAAGGAVRGGGAPPKKAEIAGRQVRGGGDAGDRAPQRVGEEALHGEGGPERDRAGPAVQPEPECSQREQRERTRGG